LKTYHPNEARAAFSKIFDRALAGEPQRLTRHGKEAVMIVAEKEWQGRARSAPSLGTLRARHARAGTMSQPITEMDAGILKLRRDGKTAHHVAPRSEQSHNRPIGLPDLIIAATAVRHGLVLLTRNMAELERLAVAAHDPFVELPADS
jgi:prevent-host-death family protein